MTAFFLTELTNPHIYSRSAHSFGDLAIVVCGVYMYLYPPPTHLLTCLFSHLYAYTHMQFILFFSHAYTHVHMHTLTYTLTELQSADGSLNAVLESPKVEGSRRRPRWKWSPISTQILTEAFKKVSMSMRARDTHTYMYMC